MPKVQAANCPPTCDFEANTNVPISEATVRVRVDGSAFQTLSYTFQFAYNTPHTIEVMNTTLYGTLTGARYVFKQWSYNGIQWSSNSTLSGNPFPILANYTSAQNGPFVAEFEKQFQASFSFTDPSGQAVTPPSSITLQGPSTVCLGPACQEPTTYSNQWLSDTVWTVTDATWQSMPGTVYGTPTIDLRNGPASTQIPLRAYSATVKVVDRSNNPIAGVSLSIRLANCTAPCLTLATDSQGLAQLGHIPLGSYKVDVVYQNQNMGSWVVDASANPVNTISLNLGGGTSGPIVSAVVLLTIFGLAMFLLLLAIKVRRPPLPPTI